jgi:hypothetical protein
MTWAVAYRLTPPAWRLHPLAVAPRVTRPPLYDQIVKNGDCEPGLPDPIPPNRWGSGSERSARQEAEVSPLAII